MEILTGPDNQTGPIGRGLKFFPLYEVEDGKRYQLNPMPEKIPVKEYVRLQGRFSHFRKKQIDAFQAEVDARWEELLERVGRHERSL